MSPRLSFATYSGPSYIDNGTFAPLFDAPDYLEDALLEPLRESVRAIYKRAAIVMYKGDHAAPAYGVRLHARNIPEEYESFLVALKRFQIAPYNLAEQDCQAPSPEQISAALTALAAFLREGRTAPSPMLLPDGTIGGSWRRGQDYASIDFDIDGQFPWATTNGETFASGVWTPGEDLPEPIRLIATRF
jgi:hypothetical protein